MSNIIIGNCINLFHKVNDNWSRIAHSTAFTLQIDILHNQVKSKDDEDEFYGVNPKNIYWELSGQSLVVDNDDMLFDIMTNGTKLFIGYGIINEGQLTPPEYGYTGYCWLTELELEAPTGDRATYKYTLKGASPLTYGIIAPPSPYPDIVFSEKDDPFIEFSNSVAEYEQDTTNNYTIPDLINPLELPIRFNIIELSN